MRLASVIDCDRCTGDVERFDPPESAAPRLILPILCGIFSIPAGRFLGYGESILAASIIFEEVHLDRVDGASSHGANSSSGLEGVHTLLDESDSDQHGRSSEACSAVNSDWLIIGDIIQQIEPLVDDYTTGSRAVLELPIVHGDVREPICGVGGFADAHDVSDAHLR